MHGFVLATCILFASTSSAVADCDADLASLKEQLKSTQSELKAAKEQLKAAGAASGQCASPFSVLDVASKTGAVAGDIMGHLLDQTTVDEQILEGFGAAKKMTSDTVDKVMSHDYNQYVEQAKKHEIYTTHLAPHINKATEAAQPYYNQYVNPALEQARVYTDPAMKNIQEASTMVYKKVGEEVLPVLTRQSSTVADTVNDVVLDPIFQRTAKAAPKHAHMLPQSKLDRVLLLAFFLFATYYALVVSGLTLRISFKTLRTTWRFFIRPPIRLVFKIIGTWIFIATGFYCCGLCRPKASVAGKKGSADAKGKAKKEAEAASEDELVKLLEASKGKAKLDPAVKLLVDKASKGLMLEGKNFPDYVQGKKVTKDVLKKALGKFKEVDVKKLGL